MANLCQWICFFFQVKIITLFITTYALENHCFFFFFLRIEVSHSYVIKILLHSSSYDNIPKFWIMTLLIDNNVPNNRCKLIGGEKLA